MGANHEKQFLSEQVQRRKAKMFELLKSKRLKKQLGLLEVYAIATGTTLSAGFFLLPGIAAAQAGPAVVLAYLLAAVPLIPSMFSVIELATAMPRAGGVYYFLDRTLGPMIGTVGGVGTWLSLVLKVSFALIGMGAYLSLFLPDIEIKPVAIALALVLGLVNLFGAKGSGRFQVGLVAGLLIILSGFVGFGVWEIRVDRFHDFWRSGIPSILSTTGLVYISYVGLTKIASLSEEVENPERNLPLGLFLALGTAFVIYGLGTAVMVGVLPMDTLAGDLTPVATAAGVLFGDWGVILVSIAAFLAFISVANAGTLSASRYPLAMSRDHLVPHYFQNLTKKGTPYLGVILTVGVIVMIVLLLDPTGIAKLASAFQLLMFALVCFAVIVMRESGIESYDPGYKAPFYPWMQVVGILSSLWLIVEMGRLPMLFSAGLIVVGMLWYWLYAKKRVFRYGAIHHIFEKLGQFRYDGLDRELRGILKEKGLREEDPFEEIVTNSHVLDVEEGKSFDEVVERVAKKLAPKLAHDDEEISRLFLEGTRVGATPVTHHVALPHLRVNDLEHPLLILVRSHAGIRIAFRNLMFDNREDEQIVHAIFFLVSPKDNPAQHLRILAQIAGRVEDEGFMEAWKSAQNQQALKEILLKERRYVSLTIARDSKSDALIGRRLSEDFLPAGCEVALVRRAGQTIVPDDNLILEDRDRLTIVGEPKKMREIVKKFFESD